MAASEYQLIIYDSNGIKRSHIVDFYELYYINRRNSVGVCQLDLDYTHPAVSLIQDRWFIEIKRRNRDMGLDWYTDYYGMVRSKETEKILERTRAIVRAFSINHMLEWRIVAYYADTEGRSTFTSCPAERIMKDLVRYNCTASATTGASRVRSGSIAGITIQSGLTGGSTVTWSGAFELLFPNLQQLADTGGGDFDLVKTGPTAYDFRFYEGQRGTDRTDSVVFSELYGNMTDISYIYDRYKEATVAIAGGRGIGASRSVHIATGVDYSATNDIETFVNATQASSLSYYISSTNKQLEVKRAKPDLLFSPIQTEQCFYGKHYTWGDRVKVLFEDYSACAVVQAVTVRVHKDGGDGIEVELKEV